eukprot:4849540-Pleurochrysis_carterae.AAC.1
MREWARRTEMYFRIGTWKEQQNGEFEAQKCGQWTRAKPFGSRDQKGQSRSMRQIRRGQVTQALP